MADWLRRSLAPLTDEAWHEIDDMAVRAIKAQTSARALVDFNGPHGLDFSAVNLGRLEIASKPAPGGVPWGLRQVQPLIELRIPIALKQLELDNISRGCRDADLEPVTAAASKLAIFEETALYNGFADGRITGIVQAAGHPALKLPADVAGYAHTVAEGIKALKAAGIGGPYALVLGANAYYPLMEAGQGGYPPRRIVKDLLEGEILWSPALAGGVLLSTRGGDFELTVGQDVAIGYASHDREKVELYLVESFAFRVLEPAAAIELKA
jgi:uncharacterized linocin/CFP29 family protein